jgi:hypothetical protein
MAYRTRDFMNEALMGLQGLSKVGDAWTQKRQADLMAKQGEQHIKESQLRQTADQRKIDDDTAARELIAGTENRGALAPVAQAGTPTADGNAVDFQAVKMANEHDAAAKLWNAANKNNPDFVPLSGGTFRKMVEGKTLTANKADQAEIDTKIEGRTKEKRAGAKEEREAAESAAGITETKARTGLLGAQTLKAKAEAEAGPKGKPPTESQSNAALFGRRLELAMKDLEQVKTNGYDASSVSAGLGRKLQKLPGGNLVTGDGAQRQRNAETNFLTAVLRKESGASISPTEFKSGEELYFDRTGDGQALKEQKARNRLQALEGLKAGAGTAWEAAKPVDVPDDISDDELDAKLRAAGIDPVTGKRIGKGGASGAF